MTDNKKDEDPAAKSGQLIRTGEPPLPLAARTGQQRTVDSLLSRLSRWPFSNKAYVNSLKTAQEVIGERTKLEETIIGHAKTRAKLNDLGTIIAQDNAQRQREWLGERRRLSAVLNETMLDGEMVDQRNKLKKREVNVKDMELEMEERRLKKQLDELQKPPPEPEPPRKTTTRGRSPKQKRREDALKRYEREITRIGAMEATAKAKAVLTKSAAAELEKEMEEIEKMP